MTIGIYKITNLITNKSYIGLSKHIEQRWQEHKNGKGNKLLYQDFIIYGINNFSFEIIEECPQEQLRQKEEYWINFYNTYKDGYNQNPGGAVAIQAVEKTRKIVYCYDLQGNFIKKYNSVSEAEQETKVPNSNISKAARGERAKAGNYLWSYENKPFLPSYKRTCNFSQRINYNQKKVCQYDKNFNLLNIYNSIKEAALITGANATCIGEICKTEGKGKRKTSGGYIWRFYNEEDKNNG